MSAPPAMMATCAKGVVQVRATIGREDRDKTPRPVRGQRLGHQIDRLGDDGDRRDLEAIDPAGRRHVRLLRQQSEQDEGDRGWKREAEPGGDPAHHPGTSRPDQDPDLAAGRAGQQLAERHEVGVGRLVEPAATLDVLAPEVAEVGDRSTE